MKVYSFSLHDAISHLIDYNIHIIITDYNINITFICTGKPKLCDSFVRKFAFLQWSRIEPEMSLKGCPYIILVNKKVQAADDQT